LRPIESICRGIEKLTNLTLIQYSLILNGSNCKSVLKKNGQNLPIHGSLRGYKKIDIERIIGRLICDGYLSETVKLTGYENYTACYLSIGPRANELFESIDKKITVEFLSYFIPKSLVVNTAYKSKLRMKTKRASYAKQPTSKPSSGQNQLQKIYFFFKFNLIFKLK